ncbi:hypothetical protein [Brucella anthropi]|uniref:Uncharacterized protein n=1 Tax=Brucella anthropi TaxID=529 RepID=A0A6L3ZAP5_BRUAN|nr:hypothetical protein [Brucella anthropi]KAB2772428.1 hypothetical protein F9L04_06820 [Brucella anthropi]UVV69943.1 hypothetical protein NW321_15320 [Brucella anthropi]
MDTDILVKQGSALTERLDATKAVPRAVMWVHNPDAGIWRLWIVPPAELTDKREFYRIMAETISQYSDEMHGLDVGSIEMVPAEHPAMQGLGAFIRMPGIGSAHFSGNRFNDFYLPDGLVIRMNI